MSLGDRIVILNEGRIQQIGTPDEVYFFPANTDVAKLFGDPEINLIEASIRNRDASHASDARRKHVSNNSGQGSSTISAIRKRESTRGFESRLRSD